VCGGFFGGGGGGVVARRLNAIRNRYKCCGSLREPTVPTCIGLLQNLASKFKNSAGYERKIASEFYRFEMT